MSHAWVMVDLTATGEVESHVRYLLGLTPSQLRLFEVLLNKEEDNYGQADLPLAIIPSTGEVVLLQLDGHLTHSLFTIIF